MDHLEVTAGVNVALPIAEGEHVVEAIVFVKKVSTERRRPTWSMACSEGVAHNYFEIAGVLDVFHDAMLARVNKADYR